MDHLLLLPEMNHMPPIIRLMGYSYLRFKGASGSFDFVNALKISMYFILNSNLIFNNQIFSSVGVSTGKKWQQIKWGWWLKSSYYGVFQENLMIFKRKKILLRQDTYQTRLLENTYTKHLSLYW